ncbi:carbohydrate ABC transporter permease [Breznakia pachnodae]|uniref:Lactose/L-arabinose transport system permease protein n=1 Tax=Breznakia pachnodae TaxID=265178 RepID=A0ABU0E4A2_9FIRM|nr:carbohydrate ABC transporter permease [Breznakia pachnodae]MDQ0361719.1 lactose/L-arabinose transport system permease protein [Breznakia pachnodae]
MTKKKVLRVLKYVMLTIISFISLFPFIWMLLGMTNNTMDITAGKMQIGDQFFANMSSLFASDLDFLGALKNSAVAAIVTTVLALLVSSAAGYAFEVYKTKRRERIFNILLLSMMVPFAALMIPLFRIFSQISSMGLDAIGIDSFISLIIPSVSTAFLIFFFRQNTKSFSKEMLEAARIDGVSEMGLFFKIYMPTLKNTYAAAAIITFMNSWNNYIWPLITIQTPDKRTLPLVLSAMGASYTPDYGMIMCGIVIATIPTAIIFLVMQKYFVAGMLGSVK